MASDGFRVLDEKSLVEYIKAVPHLSSKLGDQFDDLQIKEVGDGNLNFVFIVVNGSGSFVAKQALPYIRCIGESWPMTRERAYFEAVALKEHGGLCPGHVPEVYHFDRTMSLIVMRYLEPPHIILRKGLIAGIEYPLLAEHMSEYMARTLFFTSLLYRTTTEHKRAVHDAYCSVQSTFCLIKAGAVSPLIQILEGDDTEADEAVLGALATLLQDEIWESGSNCIAQVSGVNALIKVLGQGTIKSQEKALWILERIFRSEDHKEQYGKSGEAVLIDLAQNGDPKLKSSCAKLLAQFELLQHQSSYF